MRVEELLNELKRIKKIELLDSEVMVETYGGDMEIDDLEYCQTETYSGHVKNYIRLTINKGF